MLMYPHSLRAVGPTRELHVQMNSDTSFYKRSFVDEVRKCDDLLRILRGIEEELVVGMRPASLP